MENTTPKISKDTINIILTAVAGVIAVGAVIFAFTKPPKTIEKTVYVEVEPDEPSLSLDAEAGPFFADGYLYVPRWGVRYPLSENLTDYGYSVTPESSPTSQNYVVGLSAALLSDVGSNAQDLYYDVIRTCTIVSTARTDVSGMQIGPYEMVELGGWRYGVLPDYQNYNSCVFRKNIDTVAAELVKIFQHPEPISGADEE